MSGAPQTKVSRQEPDSLPGLPCRRPLLGLGGPIRGTCRELPNSDCGHSTHTCLAEPSLVFMYSIAWPCIPPHVLNMGPLKVAKVSFWRYGATKHGGRKGQRHQTMNQVFRTQTASQPNKRFGREGDWAGII